ncbi:MAG: type IV toxin-antitoxin system AbiEi family antitoxin domain-containing protein [Cellulomonadaceae bacterium]|jgi:predicted transcriptional regulator of viral defense system|nr:type IV toxin-antitoxin system AbiEi family antitoxin domain-containing protein [Cellulomonadaceae bacterium]
MPGKWTYREVVSRVARDPYGYVTTRQAAAADVPPIEIPKLAARGGLKRIGYGIYRIPEISATSHRP